MTLPDALTEVARRVGGDAWRVREDAVSSDEVAQVATRLLDAVLAEHAGRDPGELQRTTLARRVLDLCRRHMLAVWSESPGDAVGLLNVLGAVERVADRIQPGWDTRFTDRMAGPDGLELVSEIVHDLRSPLTSILFLAETLLRGQSGPVTAVQERQLALIYSAAFGLSAVTSDVMDLIRGQDRLTDPEPLPFSVADVMASVRNILAPLAQEKGVALECHPPAEPFRLGHPVALNRLLLNLGINALKHTEEGSVTLVAEDAADGGVAFTVLDTGPGLPPEAVELLFEPFRRRPRDRAYAFSGPGLGLSMSRKLVEALGGELTVEATPAQGTKFHFALPLPVPAFDAPTVS